MSMGSDVPDPPNPAKRPERKDTITPEDIVVADSDSDDEDRPTGRRALRRPTGGAVGSDVGTGLSA